MTLVTRHNLSQETSSTKDEAARINSIGAGWATFAGILLLPAAVPHLVCLLITLPLFGGADSLKNAYLLGSGMIFWSASWCFVLYILKIRLLAQGVSPRGSYNFVFAAIIMGLLTTVFLSTIASLSAGHGSWTVLVLGLLLFLAMSQPLLAYFICPQFLGDGPLPTFDEIYGYFFLRALLFWFTVFVLTGFAVALSTILVGFVFAGFILGFAVMIQAKSFEGFILDWHQSN